VVIDIKPDVTPPGANLTQNNTPPDTSGSGSVVVWVLGSILLLAVLIGLAVWYVRRKPESDKADPELPAPKGAEE